MHVPPFEEKTESTVLGAQTTHIAIICLTGCDSQSGILMASELLPLLRSACDVPTSLLNQKFQNDSATHSVTQLRIRTVRTDCADKLLFGTVLHNDTTV